MLLVLNISLFTVERQNSYLIQNDIPGDKVFWMHFGIVHKGKWSTVPGYPQSISAKFGASSPPAVDAAESDTAVQMVYLVYHDLLYSYSWLADTTINEHTYTFVSMVDMTLNDVSNPFSAGPLSELAHAPRHIDAMWRHADALGAVVQHWIYDYNITQKSWAYMGRVIC